MQGADLSLGVAGLVVATAALADGARRVAVRGWPGDGPVKLLAATLLGTCGVVLVLEVLGVAAIMRAPYVIGFSVALWLAALAATRPRGVPHSAAPAPAGQRGAGLALTVAIAGAGLLLLASLVQAALSPGPEFDAMATHLPVAVQWLQAGAIRGLPYLAPLSWQAHYPANSELLALWVMVPLHRDFLVQLAGVPALVMAVLGAGVLARTLGARDRVALGAALLAPTLPLTLADAVGTNMEDIHLLGALAAMAAFTALEYRRPSRWNALAAGLAAGYAVGSRYAGLLAVLPIAALFVVTVLRGRHAPLPRIAIATLAALLAGAFWYARNLLLTGDPVYPQPVPWSHVVVVEQLQVLRLTSYAAAGWRPADWARIGFDILRYYGPIYPLLVVTALLLAVRAVRGPRRPLVEALWLLVPLSELLVFLVMPASAGQVIDGRLQEFLAVVNARYLVPGLALTAAVAAAELQRSRDAIAERAMACILGIAGLATVVLMFAHPPIAGRRLSLPAVVIALVVIAAVVAGPRLPLRRLRRGQGLAAACAGAAAALVATAPALAAHYDRQRLPASVPFEGARLHLLASDQIVDVAGICRIYGLYGPDLARRVVYLTGADDRIDRPLASTYEAWRQSLQSNGVTAVVAGNDLCYRDVPVPQRSWLREHPERFELTYSDGESEVYRIHA